MATKLRMFAVTHESVTVAVGSDKKMQTALRTNRIQIRYRILWEKINI